MNIVFICQKGELEIKAVLLAWSLRNTHGASVNLYAAIPQQGDWNYLAKETTALLNFLGVVLLDMPSPFGEEYPIGNKITAIGLLPDNEPGCFLDSDIVSMEPWFFEIPKGKSLAKPADLGTWSENWEYIYQKAGLNFPSRRVRLTVSNTLSLPYFNAGVVATCVPKQLSAQWLALAKELIKDGAVSNKFPWLDQITLPLAFEKAGTWGCLSEYFNFPAHLRSIGEHSVGLCHYHNPAIFLTQPRLMNLFYKAIAEMPLLRDLVLNSAAWAALLNPVVKLGLGSSNKHRNFLITGIPRSGTSYLASVLDAQQDWLVINEPAQIFSELETRSDASGIEKYHVACREQVILGQPIENKVLNGRVVEDTAQLDRRNFYNPEICRADFWLGSKNTLAYMASLEKLLKLEWPIVAMIRHPSDTLASWRNTFEHLKNADVLNFPVANPSYPSWASWQRNSLNEVANAENPKLRRVLLWRMLAKTLMNQSEQIHLWRYEDLIEQPNVYVNKFNAALHYHGKANISKSVIKARDKDHDPEESEMLRDLCWEELKFFKYM